MPKGTYNWKEKIGYALGGALIGVAPIIRNLMVCHIISCIYNGHAITLKILYDKAARPDSRPDGQPAAHLFLTVF